jgi:ankyrin repeat protein
VSDTPPDRQAALDAFIAACRHGDVGEVRRLIAAGFDVNTREPGDNTTGLHWAAARADQPLVPLLLGPGADVRGAGDLHELDVIGWAAYFRDPGTADVTTMDADRRACIDDLVERGARHHIFSAMCVGDLALIRDVAARPGALDRRMSRFEHRLTPLHFAVARGRHDILSLLLELGADPEATDAAGQTPLTAAMLRGDREAAARLLAAGAKAPSSRSSTDFRAEMSALAGTVSTLVPMIKVPDVARALDWYVAIGFEELARYEDDGLVNFGIVAFGGARVMLTMHGGTGRHDAALWFYTDAVDRLYEALKARQIQAARAALDDPAAEAAPFAFGQDIEDMFYGARQFCIRDPFGYEIYFIQELATGS